MTTGEKSEQQAGVSQRNGLIAQYLQQGLSPVLPFEEGAIQGTLDTLANEQSSLGKELGAAMRQSSETWHDNAPAEAVASQSIIVAARAKLAHAGLANSINIGYPEETFPYATLGSLVEITYQGDDTPEHVYLTGIVRDLETINRLTNADLPESVDVVTVSSPLGMSLLDGQEGDTRMYSVNDKNFAVHIRAVAQRSINEQPTA